MQVICGVHVCLSIIKLFKYKNKTIPTTLDDFNKTQNVNIYNVPRQPNLFQSIEYAQFTVHIHLHSPPSPSFFFFNIKLSFAFGLNIQLFCFKISYILSIHTHSDNFQHQGSMHLRYFKFINHVSLVFYDIYIYICVCVVFVSLLIVFRRVNFIS